VQIHYDSRAGDFLLISGKYSDDLISQTIASDGSLSEVITRPPIPDTNGYFGKTVADVTSSEHNFLICATARATNRQIYGWHASPTMHGTTDLVFPPDTEKERNDPFLAGAGSSLYMTWIEDGNLYFGKVGD
jgi:hypothetical protein